MPALAPPPSTIQQIDDNLAAWIGRATLMIEADTGRRTLLVDGGRFVRCGTGWRYRHGRSGDISPVTVPTTIAALEARDAQLRAVPS
jgi:hypothetical protein